MVEAAAVKPEETDLAWGIHHRLSTAYNPHFNSWVELAVKMGKRLLRDNVGPGGTLNTEH